MGKFEDGPDQRRHRGMFKPGQSGNPGGRPKHRINEIAEASGEHAHEVLAMMLEAMRDKQASWPARIAAGIAVWDRCLGKPLQTMLNMQEDVDLRELSDAELTAIIRRANGGNDPAGPAGNTNQPH
jgi:hypothetical protein